MMFEFVSGRRRDCDGDQKYWISDVALRVEARTVACASASMPF